MANASSAISAVIKTAVNIRMFPLRRLTLRRFISHSSGQKSRAGVRDETDSSWEARKCPGRRFLFLELINDARRVVRGCRPVLQRSANFKELERSYAIAGVGHARLAYGNVRSVAVEVAAPPIPALQLEVSRIAKVTPCRGMAILYLKREHVTVGIQDLRPGYDFVLSVHHGAVLAIHALHAGLAVPLVQRNAAGSPKWGRAVIDFDREIRAGNVAERRHRTGNLWPTAVLVGRGNHQLPILFDGDHVLGPGSSGGKTKADKRDKAMHPLTSGGAQTGLHGELLNR